MRSISVSSSSSSSSSGGPFCTTSAVISVVLALLCTGAVAQQRKIVLKVNLGGGPVADFLGEEQVLDVSDFPKNVVKSPITNTDQPSIFQTTRFARRGDLTLRIPVPTGIYSLTLLFAETFQPACVPGARVFDISLGTPISGVVKIVDAFDVFAAAGCLSAHGKRFDKVPSKDGIVLNLSRKAQHPALAGFIVEGFPLPMQDGSHLRAVGRVPDPPPSAYAPDATALSVASSSSS